MITEGLRPKVAIQSSVIAPAGNAEMYIKKARKFQRGILWDSELNVLHG